MSKSKNSIELNNVFLTYDYKHDQIYLTSKDPELDGERFSLTLNPETKSEISARKMLKKNNIIINDNYDDFLPFNVSQPSELKSPDAFYLGYSRKGVIKWDPKTQSEASNVLCLAGWVKTGKTNLIKNMAKQALDNDFYTSILTGSNHDIDEYAEAFNNNAIHLTKHNAYEEALRFKKEYSLNSSKKCLLVVEGLEWILGSSPNETEENKVKAKLAKDIIVEIVKCASYNKNTYIVISSLSALYFSNGASDDWSYVTLGEINEEDSELMFGMDISPKTKRLASGQGYVSIFGEDPVLFSSFKN